MLNLIDRNKVIRNENNFIGGVGGFNPNFDGNALAWYDGNAGLTNLQWNDQGAGGHDIIFTNLPTIVPNATPLRDAVRFNGIDQNGNVTTPAVNQPFTIYLVVKSITWSNNDRIFDDGVTTPQKTMSKSSVSPNLIIYSGLQLDSNPDLALNDYGVMSGIYNGVTSEIRTNLNASVVGNAGTQNGNGITLGSTPTALLYGNIEIGYLILRTGADSTAIQNRIINGLKAACGLTF